MNISRTVSKLLKQHRKLFSRMITDYDHLRRIAKTQAERTYWECCIINLNADYVRRKGEVRKAVLESRAVTTSLTHVTFWNNIARKIGYIIRG